MIRALIRSAASLLPLLALASAPPPARVTPMTPDVVAKYDPVLAEADYVKRVAMVPMRDGTKLYTVIIMKKGTRNGPILLSRTPYDAKGSTNRTPSQSVVDILPIMYKEFVNDGYIIVQQDIRGLHNSEGQFVMNRPIVGPLNNTGIDESTDAYDAIDWLVKNVPESNGRVGTIGSSYLGFLTLASEINPHPALKAAVPQSPMVDGWMGDDWFHNGAFREQNMPYVLEQEATRDNTAKWWTDHFDDYDLYLQGGSAGALGKAHGLEQVGFWNKIVAHPSYDAWWRTQAMDKVLAAEPLAVPVMLVHSLWDQEDIYGAIALYKALEPKDTGNDKLFLV
ncbi:MAG: CocE/NonD family hydrolase, partial [Sphingomicrobium sp.]